MRKPRKIVNFESQFGAEWLQIGYFVEVICLLLYRNFKSQHVDCTATQRARIINVGQWVHDFEGDFETGLAVSQPGMEPFFT